MNQAKTKITGGKIVFINLKTIFPPVAFQSGFYPEVRFEI
jgi:hypothetical protein